MKPSLMTERIQCDYCGRWYAPAVFFLHWHEEEQNGA